MPPNAVLKHKSNIRLAKIALSNLFKIIKDLSRRSLVKTIRLKVKGGDKNY